MAYEEEFNQVGENNLLTSHKVEPGTLAMYSTHVPDDPATCYVFEVYADEDAYNVHAASPQFGEFVKLAGKALTGRSVYQLVPRLMIEKPEELCVTGETAIEPHLVYVDIKPGTENDGRLRLHVAFVVQERADLSDFVILQFHDRQGTLM